MNAMAGDRCKGKCNTDEEKFRMKISLQMFAILITFLPDCYAKVLSIEEFSKEKHTELECTSSFDKVKFSLLTLTCFSCYERSEENFISCRSKCFSTSKYEECIKKIHSSNKEYYFELANEYNRKEVFPLVNRRSFFVRTLKESSVKNATYLTAESIRESECPDLIIKSPSKRYILGKLGTICSSCAAGGDYEEYKSCSAKCYRTLKFKECIGKVYGNKEYYLNLVNILNERITSTSEATDEVQIKRSEPSEEQRLNQKSLVIPTPHDRDRFSLDWRDFSSEKHIELNCTARYDLDTFANLTLICFACYRRKNKVEFNVCRHRCFVTNMYNICIRKIFRRNYQYYLKLAYDYRVGIEETVHPSTASEKYPETTTALIRKITPIIRPSKKISFYEDILSKEYFYSEGCISSYQKIEFTVLTYSCYFCFPTDPGILNFYNCRSNCFATWMFTRCIRVRYPHLEEYFFGIVNKLKLNVVHRSKTTPHNKLPWEIEPLKNVTPYLNEDDFTEEKQKEIGCTSRLENNDFALLTYICRDCYPRSEIGFFYCRNHCFFTRNFLDCVRNKFRFVASHFVKMVQEYNQHSIKSTQQLTENPVTAIDLKSPFFERQFEHFTINKDVDGSIRKHEELGCTLQYDKEKLYALTIPCYLCNSIKPSSLFEACRSKCFSTLHYQGCVSRNFPTYLQEYYFNLTNDYNGRKIFPMLTNIPVFHLTYYDFTKYKHKDVGCVSQFNESNFSYLTLLCYSCLFYLPSTNFESCRSECFSTEWFRYCVRSLHPLSFEDDLKFAHDYNQTAVQPSDSNVGLPITTDQFVEKEIITKIPFKFYAHHDEFTQEIHAEIGCTSRFQVNEFSLLSIRCYDCYNTSEEEFNSCRFKCFSTSKFRECARKMDSLKEEYFFKLANDYNQKTVHPVKSTELYTEKSVTSIELETLIPPEFHDFSLDENVDGSIKKHKELGCTSHYDKRKLYQLTTFCYECNYVKPHSLFEACRSECFSTLHYQGCVVNSLVPDWREHFFNLANDYNDREIFPIETVYPVFYLTHDDFTKDKHEKIGCTSPFIGNKFYNLTMQCYSCNFYIPDTKFELCRAKCFSTERFTDCIQYLYPNTSQHYLKLLHDYIQ